jgi:hypothetical protein
VVIGGHSTCAVGAGPDARLGNHQSQGSGSRADAEELAAARRGGNAEVH